MLAIEKHKADGMVIDLGQIQVTLAVNETMCPCIFRTVRCTAAAAAGWLVLQGLCEDDLVEIQRLLEFGLLRRADPFYRYAHVRGET